MGKWFKQWRLRRLQKRLDKVHSRIDWFQDKYQKLLVHGVLLVQVAAGGTSSEDVAQSTNLLPDTLSSIESCEQSLARLEIKKQNLRTRIALLD